MHKHNTNTTEIKPRIRNDCAWGRLVRKHTQMDEFYAKFRIKRPGEMKTLMPDQTIIGLLHRQQVMMISGGSKAYKSWLLKQLGVCVASGANFLNFPVNKGKVLYINFELLEAEAHRRLMQISHALGLKDIPGNIRVASLKGQKLTIESLLTFKQMILREKITVIVIDPIYKLYTGKDENSIEGISGILHHLEKLAMETEASVIFAHHYSKGAQGAKRAMDRASGSGGFARSPDTLFAMSDNDDKGAQGGRGFSIEIDVRSFPPILPFGITHDFPIFRLDETLDPANVPGRPRKPPKHSDEEMLAPLRVNAAGLLNGEWFRVLNNGAGKRISEATFTRRVKQLRDEKKVVQSHSGHYRDAAKADIDAFAECSKRKNPK